MHEPSEVLNNLQIASPCEASWDKMRGTDRVRLCEQCGLNVFNISSMTREEAQDLVLRTEGRLCVRFHRREDGTVLTRDCPVGIWQRMRRTSLFGIAAIFASAVIVGATNNPISDAAFNVEPFKSILNIPIVRAFFRPAPPPQTQVFLGMMAPAPIPTPPNPSANPTTSGTSGRG
jgi:hypothetical protein